MARRNTTSSHFAVGARIGDYQIERELRSERTGMVYAAKHLVLPRHAALKVMHEHPGGLRGMAVQVLREACVLESLDRSPGVPRVYETGVLADRRPWYALEAIVGPSLAQRLVDGPLPAIELLALLRDVAQTLVRLHDFGAIHGRIIEDTIVQGPAGHHHLIEWSEVTTGADADPAFDIHALGKLALRAMENARGDDARGTMPTELLLLIDDLLGDRDRPTAERLVERSRSIDIPVEPRNRRWTPHTGTMDLSGRLGPRPSRTRT